MKDKKEEFYTARGYEIIAGENVLTPSMEDYLEMIVRLSKNTDYTRVNDLAESLNVQPPSVTKMVKKLHEKGLLDYKKYGMIHLTEKGARLGEYFLERHNTLKEFLTLLGATKHLQRDVERLEHYISYETYQIINALTNFFKDNEVFLQQFKEYKNNFQADSPNFDMYKEK